MKNCKTTFKIYAKLVLPLAAISMLLLASCSTLNAPPPSPQVCSLIAPSPALMQSRPNGALTIGLQRLEAALTERIEAGNITAGEIIAIARAAAERLAELGDQTNASLIALQEWTQAALKRCAPP